MNNYQVHIVSANAIVIQDMNNGVSVTNSIERVLSHFQQHHQPIGERRFFYYDSEGMLTEAVHKSGQFLEFRHPNDLPEELRC